MSAIGEPGERGATLLEALVVLAITAMITAIAFPSLERGLAGQALTHGARTLAADLATARARAVRRGEAVAFSIGEDGHSYGWTGSDVRQAPSGVSLSMTPAVMMFSALGRTEGGQVLLRRDRSQRIVTVEAASGRTYEVRP